MKAAAMFSLTGRVALVTGAPAGSVSSLPAQHEASSFDSLRIVEVFSRKMDVINERDQWVRSIYQPAYLFCCRGVSSKTTGVTKRVISFFLRRHAREAVNGDEKESQRQGQDKTQETPED